MDQNAPQTLAKPVEAPELHDEPESPTTGLPEALASILDSPRNANPSETLARVFPTDQIDAAVEHLAGITRGQWRRLPESVQAAIEQLEVFAEGRRGA